MVHQNLDHYELQETGLSRLSLNFEGILIGIDRFWKKKGTVSKIKGNFNKSFFMQLYLGSGKDQVSKVRVLEMSEIDADNESSEEGSAEEGRMNLTHTRT